MFKKLMKACKTRKKNQDQPPKNGTIMCEI